MESRKAIAIGREMLERVRPSVQGVQVSAPFGKVELALEVFRTRLLVSLAKRGLSYFVAALLVVATPTPAAHAQSLKSLRLQVDNDWFLFWRPSTNRPDDNYTHGNLARAVFNTAPRWASFGRPRLLEWPPCRAGATVG
jgi:hypothetical protein